MTSLTTANSLRNTEIVALVTQIISMLPPASECAAQSVHAHRVSAPHFAVPKKEDLDFDLGRLGVTPACRTNLIEVYLSKMEVLENTYQYEYGKVFRTMQQEYLYEEAHDLDFKNLLARLFVTDSQKMWRVVLQETEKHLIGPKRPEYDIAKVGLDQPAYDEGSLKAGRGHDSDAVRILEQAFEHTPNITQAEKFQLAEATGLQPKQVTIWFQNRRNRKGKKGPKLGTTSQYDFDPLSFKNGSPPSSPTRDFTLSEKKRKSYGALGRSTLDSSSYDSDSHLSLPKKPRLPSADLDVSDGSGSSYEDHGVFTCWSTPSSRSNSSSLDSSSLSDFDSPRKPRNVFNYMKPRTLDVKAIASVPRLTIPAPQQPTSTNATQGQRSPFLCDNPNGNVATGANIDSGGLQFNLGGMADDQSFRDSVQRVLSSVSGYEADISRNASSSSWVSQQSTTDDDGWEDVDDSTTSHVTGGSQEQHASMTSQVDTITSQEVAQASSFPRAQSAPLAHMSTNNAIPQPELFDGESIDLSQFFQSASMPTQLPSMMIFPQQRGLYEVPLPTNNTQDLGEIEKPLDMDLDDIQSILDSNIFASSLPSSQQSNGGSAPEDASAQGHNAVAGAEMGEGVFQMNFDLDSNSFGFV